MFFLQDRCNSAAIGAPLVSPCIPFFLIFWCAEPAYHLIASPKSTPYQHMLKNPTKSTRLLIPCSIPNLLLSFCISSLWGPLS